jgi:hypothetical protein
VGALDVEGRVVPSRSGEIFSSGGILGTIAKRPGVKRTVVMSEEPTASADAENDAGHTDEGNLSFQDVVASRLAQQTEPEQEEVEEPLKPEVEDSEVSTEEEEEAETTQLPVDLEKLSEEEIESLRAHLIKGAEKRIGKLTAKKKAADEEVERLKSQLEQKPAFEEPALESNPYSDIESAEELNTKYGETAKFIEDFRAILDENDDASNDEEIYEEDDQSWTKKQVKAAIRNAEKAKDKFLPARLQELRRLEGFTAQSAQFQAQATEEVTWMADEDSELRKEFDSYMNSPVIQKVIKAVPEFGPLAPYMIAHAINSAKGKPSSIKAPEKPKLSPTSPVKSSAAPSAPTGDKSKLIAELEKRFEESGSAHDASKLRAAKMTTV